MKYFAFFILTISQSISSHLKFTGHLNRENLHLLVYSIDFTTIEKIDLYKGNIETIDTYTFKGTVQLNTF